MMARLAATKEQRVTSRESSGFLPRREDFGPHLARKSPGDWAHIAFFGAIGWPWLVRSLSGGSQAVRRALLARLALPPHALPNLGSWKADAGFLSMIADEILAKKPQTVVEFGAGASSLIAARALKINGSGSLTSFDQHRDYAEGVKTWLADFGLAADINHAPLKQKCDGWPGRWYDHGPLPEHIDLLLVDGPPWAVHPYVRGAADSLFARISPGGAVMMDDGARPGERVVAARWRRRWPDFEFNLVNGGTKGTLVGRRR